MPAKNQSNFHMKKTILHCFLVLALCLPLLMSAQVAPCGFDRLHRALQVKDPTYARRVEENNRSIRQFIQSHPQLQRPGQHRGTAAIYTIPVVVHVMHTGGAVGTIYNPTDAQIMGAITYLNNVYAGTHTGMTAPVEGGGVVDMEIEFALAQRTPACGATNGIDRVDASSIPNYTANGVNANGSSGCADITLKNFARWNPSDYYNIWVVNKIDGADGTSGQFIAGYAYFAGAPSTLDGTVMLATQMISGQKTLPHEVGHAMNLYHPFEDSDDDTQCPAPPANCATTGDQVCDTDPIALNFNVGTQLFNFACRTGPNGCASPNNYTINTESNFMSYTNCYTLFTNGQKARVQAAMSLPSRASLVSPSNLALTPCGTSINFNQASSSRTEDITGTLAGCRRYRDFTYQLAIGAAPSATATATLTFSGTATRGLDYDVTTNGTFSVPSLALTFPSGSTAAQSFTVRIYDDAEVEVAETAIIDFTLNNGGGNATKGTATPTLTISLTDNDIAPSGTVAVTANIGLANTGVTQPFRGQFSDSRTQILYTKADLNAAGINAPASIASIAFNVISKVSTGAFNNFTVKMKNTTSTTYTGGSFETGATQVFTGNYTTVAGYNTITLSTPFNWNGTDNLLIDICYDNSTATGSGVGTDILAGTSALPMSQFDRVDGAAGCALATGGFTFVGGGARPNIRIVANIIASTVETAAGATSSDHIDIGSDEYFYSNNGKLLMRLRGVDAMLGCVSSSLDNGGTTWVNYLGGQRSAKVFAVTPTSNAGTASYSIDLYFDNTELDGKLPGNLRLAKTTAGSVAAATGANTVFVTPTVSTLGSGITIFSYSFTGFSRFFLVDAGATLPVTLVDFTGHLDNSKNAVLNWQTSTEQNSKQFDVEVSRDGSQFARIGTVASKGNSSAKQDYEFVQMNPASGMNWYRLKQIDQDGKFKYSKVIILNVDKGLVKPSLFPVPATDRITINFGKLMSNVSVSLYTAEMKLVRSERTSGPNTRKDMSISDLAPGVYFIKLSGENTNELMRFVKQ